MFRHLFVPLDGSPFAASVIPLARDLARRAGGEVRFAVVTPPFPPPVATTPPIDPELEATLRVQNRRYLDAVLAREAGHGVPVSGEALEGPVVDTLADAIRDHGSDLVVLATHGRGGLSRVWLGSTATGLIRQAPAPLLLLRPGEGEGLAPLRPRRVLVPVEANGFGEQIIWDALALAGVEGVEYHVIQVIPPVPVLLSGASPERDQRVFGERQAAAAGHLATIKDAFTSRGAACVASVRVSDQVAREIMAYAEAEQCDLIAMATHGRGGVGRLFIGSVADKVIRGCQRPLLLRGPGA